MTLLHEEVKAVTDAFNAKYAPAFTVSVKFTTSRDIPVWLIEYKENGGQFHSCQTVVSSHASDEIPNAVSLTARLEEQYLKRDWHYEFDRRTEKLVLVPPKKWWQFWRAR